MHNPLRQMAQAWQALRVIQVGQHRNRVRGAYLGAAAGFAQHRENPEVWC